MCIRDRCRVNLNLSKCLLLFQFLGVYLGVEFQTHPIMNIKRNIIFALESRKKNGVPIVENVPIRMRVIYARQRIEFTTGYRIDAVSYTHLQRRQSNENFPSGVVSPTSIPNTRLNSSSSFSEPRT